MKANVVRGEDLSCNNCDERAERVAWIEVLYANMVLCGPCLSKLVPILQSTVTEL